MESSSLDTPKHASRIHLIVPIYLKSLRNTDVYANFQFFVVIIRYLRVGKY